MKYSDLMKNATIVQPLGTVPWIGLIGSKDVYPGGQEIGFDDRNAVNLVGTGYWLYDRPVYPLSSSSLLQWNSGNQQVSALSLDGVSLGGLSIEEFSTLKADDMPTELKMQLMSATARNASQIRQIQAFSLAVILGVTLEQVELIQRVTGLGEDLFTEIFTEVSNLLTPKAEGKSMGKALKKG